MPAIKDSGSTKILVLGKNGFLGRNVYYQLKSQGFKVFGLNRVSMNSNEDKNQISLETLVRSDNSLGFTTAIFCGNPPMLSSEKEYVQSTYFVDVNIAKIFKQIGFKRIIWTGSYWQDFTLNRTSREDIYIKSKQITESFLLSMSDSSFNVTSIRIGDTYGYNDTRKKVIPQMLKVMNSRKVFKIKNPNAKLNLVNISDIAIGFNLVVSNSEIHSKIYKLYADNLISVKNLAEIIKSISPEFYYELQDRKGINLKEFNSNLNINPRPYGWKPLVELQQGLTNLIGL